MTSSQTWRYPQRQPHSLLSLNPPSPGILTCRLSLEPLLPYPPFAPRTRASSRLYSASPSVVAAAQVRPVGDSATHRALQGAGGGAFSGTAPQRC
jgi:hypothetical protein